MKPSIFITGISGFLGRTLIKKIDPAKYKSIYCLLIEPTDMFKSYPANFIPIIGDLEKPETYKNYLSETDIVIHMASVTGKVSPKIYTKNIVEGTGKLINACKEQNVKNFIYLSSIAAKFKNIKRYYYGIAKLKAEQLIKDSGLNYSIIRPTMIMGINAPVFDGFAGLTSLPIIPVFGNGKTKIQPVIDSDVADLIISISNKNHFNNKILEIGGPDILTIDEFLKKIKSKKTNQENVGTKIFHIPIGLTVFGLTILEIMVYKFLPITVGQLATFRNDSIADNDSFLKKSTELIGVDEMIKVGLKNKKVPDLNTKILEKECKTFCKYLSGIKANEYVIENYLKYHSISKIEEINKPPLFDNLLLKFARIHPAFTKFIDIYTKFVKPQTIFRFKLSYLLAILEVSSPYYEKIDFTKGIGKLSFLILLGLKGGLFGLQLILSVIFLLPFDLIFRVIGGNNKETKNV